MEPPAGSSGHSIGADMPAEQFHQISAIAERFGFLDQIFNSVLHMPALPLIVDFVLAIFAAYHSENDNSALTPALDLLHSQAKLVSEMQVPDPFWMNAPPAIVDAT